MDQKERLEQFEKSIIQNNLKEKSYSMPIKIALEELRLIRENKEYNNKLKHFEEKEVYCTSSKDIIIYVEVGRIKNRD